jgi:hypothetical protein
MDDLKKLTVPELRTLAINLGAIQNSARKSMRKAEYIQAIEDTGVFAVPGSEPEPAKRPTFDRAARDALRPKAQTVVRGFGKTILGDSRGKFTLANFPPVF